MTTAIMMTNGDDEDVDNDDDRIEDDNTR